MDHSQLELLLRSERWEQLNVPDVGGAWRKTTQRGVRLLLATAPGLGVTHAERLARRVQETFAPRWVVVLGTALGVGAAGVRPGDLVVVNEVLREASFERLSAYRCDAEIVHDLAAILGGDEAPSEHAHVGALFSAPSPTRGLPSASHAQLLAVELEGANGVFAELAKSAVPTAMLVSIHSLIDDPGRQKTHSQSHANAISASLLRSFLNRLSADLTLSAPEPPPDPQLGTALAEILETTLTELERATGTGYNQIFLLSATDSGARLTAVADAVAPDKERYRIASHEGLLGAALAGEVVNEGHVEHAPRYLRTIPETRSELAVPIRTPAGSVLGVINSENEREAGFDTATVSVVLWLATDLGQQLASFEPWLREQTPETLPWIQRTSSSRHREQVLPRESVGKASPRALKRYCKALYEATGFLAQWLPNHRVRVGDIGIFGSPGHVTWVGSLATFGITHDVRITEAPARVEQSWGASVALGIRADGGSEHVTVSFERSGGFLLEAKGCRTERLDDEAELGAELLRLREQGIWDAAGMVVTEVLVAQRATLLLASAPNSAVTLALDSRVENGELADLSSATVTESSGSVDQFIGMRDATPLFKALHVRTSLLGRAKVVAFSGQWRLDRPSSR